MSCGLTSGTTKGKVGSCLNADELSITTQPASAAIGQYSLETDPPALNKAISIPLNESLVNS